MGALSFLSGLFGAANNRTSINAQRAENEAARQHNLELAKMQNKFNIDQWNRENAYNSPAAQMQRFAAAGLNPNLIYGQSNTSGQISGSLTSGSPASPADIGGLLAQKDGNIAKAFGSLGKALMELPMYREQLKEKRLENEAQAIENRRNERQDDIESIFLGKGASEWSSIMENDSDFDAFVDSSPAPVARMMFQLRRDYYEAKNVAESYKEKIFLNGIHSATFDNVVKRIANEAKISEANAKYAFELYSAQAMGLQHSANITKKQDEWMTIDKIIESTGKVVDIFANGYSAVFGGKFTTITETFNEDKGNSYTRQVRK